MSVAAQVTDDDSIELTSATQLSPHSPTDVTTSEDDKKKEYVSLDETYEVTGQEALHTLAANCREFMNNKRLHPSAFTALNISGSESMLPMYDRMNAVKGGESFLSTLKAGFIALIKAAKKFLIMVIDWIVLKIRTLLGFEKTEGELAIVAKHAETTKRDVLALLASLTGSEKIDLNVPEFFEALPGNVTQQEAFSIVYDRNKKIIDQIETLTVLQTKLGDVDETIKKASGYARQARGRYQQAVTRLRNAWKDQNTFSSADVIEFRAALDQDIAININPEPIRAQLATLVNEAYGIDLGSIGVDKAFKQQLSAHKDVLNKQIPVRVTPDEFARVRNAASKMSTVMMLASHPFDADVLGALKEIIEVSDADLIESIDNNFDKAGILKMSYTSYCSTVNEYSWALNQLITISGNLRRSIAGIVNWSNKVDRLMLSYISKDLRTILTTEQQLLNDNGKNIAGIRNENGDIVGSQFTMNYDELYIAKHPYIGSALQAYRAKTGDLRNNYKVIERINNGLKLLGVNSRI